MFNTLFKIFEVFFLIYACYILLQLSQYINTRIHDTIETFIMKVIRCILFVKPSLIKRDAAMLIAVNAVKAKFGPDYYQVPHDLDIPSYVSEGIRRWTFHFTFDRPRIILYINNRTGEVNIVENFR